jgi:TonB family protein
MRMPRQHSFLFILLFCVFSTCVFAQHHNGRYVRRYNIFHKYILGHYNKHHDKTGEWVEWNRDGTIRTIQYFENGLADGPYINMLSKISGFYKANKMDSVWTQSLNSGIDSMTMYRDNLANGRTWTKRENTGVISEGYFKEGLRDSVYTYLMPNGTRMEGKYKLGKKVGKWTYTTASSYKQKEEFFINDSLALRVTFSGKDTLKEEKFVHGRIVQEHSISYYSQGKKKSEEFFANPTGMKGMTLNDSVWREWKPNGSLLSETTWKNGAKSGAETMYFDDGKLRSVIMYKNNKQDGPSAKYYAEGGPMEDLNFLEGLKQGACTWYYANGKKSKQANYIHDTLNGLFVEWYANGTKKREFTYEMGIIVGKFTAWNENGKPVINKTYKKSDGKRTADTLGDMEEVVVGPDKKTETGKEEIFTFVEVMPEFPGGQEALYKYLAAQLRYPDLEKENGIYGTVYVSFVVDKEGKVKDAKIEKGVPGGPGLDKEALRVIKGMPDWQPGKMNGRKVSVQLTIPVKYLLK